MATLSALRPVPTEQALEVSLNIVIIVTYAHPYIGSGLGVVAKWQAECLASRGHRVTLISSNIPKTSPVFQLHGVTYIKVPALAVLERFHVPVPVLFFNKRVFSAIRKADVVHIHDMLYPSSFAAALVAKLQGKRVILTQHVPHVHYSNRIINAIEKLAFVTVGLATLRMSNAAIVMNTSICKWIKRYKKEVYHLPNGVDLNLFTRPLEQEKQAIREQYGLPHDRFIVLFVGRFVPKKGFDTLYNAKDPSYLLLFVGGGIIPDYMQCDHSVRLMGPLPQEELAQIYKASDVFILPSYGEGGSPALSIQEAMATGLPIITSKHNNLDHILDSPLITYIDITEADIKAAIKKIQSDTSLQKEMSTYSNKIATESYSWEKNITNLLDIYRRKDVTR